MNWKESVILNTLYKRQYLNQRELAAICGFSLGTVNQTVHNLMESGYLSTERKLTEKAFSELKKSKPRNAIILAAGLGMRMVPINTITSKAFLTVRGELLIERLICQLHEVGITEIHIVVGFMKEQFEYLIDKYGVNLIVNENYAQKNNLHSLAVAMKHLSNSYIVPCDIWCAENPFRTHELHSWYMLSDEEDTQSSVYINRKMEISLISKDSVGNKMIGIAYLLEDTSKIVCDRLTEFSQNHIYDNSFWEDTLYSGDRMIVSARKISADQIFEINNYEQLRDLDKNSNALNSDAITMISNTLQVDSSEITGIEVLKKGMTNRSFLFSCKGKRYIMRLPGAGTDQLINRMQEANVYEVLNGTDISDTVCGLDPQKGFKITEFIEGARVCDPQCEEDLQICMKKLRNFHELKLTVKHSFDLFGQIDFYEKLWDGSPSAYTDYKKTYENVFLLRPYIEAHSQEHCLTHIDAVPDNFLISDNTVNLIDWEYAGMQDPHVDIAMFCIYAMYDRKETDRLIDIYFENHCSDETRIKIYCYIAVCGLLWSNWCEYKRNLGIEFGEYSLKQYRYAKVYYRIVKDLLEQKGEIL